VTGTAGGIARALEAPQQLPVADAIRATPSVFHPRSERLMDELDSPKGDFTMADHPLHNRISRAAKFSRIRRREGKMARSASHETLARSLFHHHSWKCKCGVCISATSDAHRRFVRAPVRGKHEHRESIRQSTCVRIFKFLLLLAVAAHIRNVTCACSFVFSNGGIAAR